MAFFRKLGAVLLAAILLLPVAEAGSLSKTFARAAVNKILKRDLARDAATAVKPLARSRHVWRYAMRKQAGREARYGIRPGSHMTAQTTRGRPPSPEAAQRRYGLPHKPEVRETWRLPAGTPVRSNKAFGGAPGVGELTSTRHLPPENLVRTTPLASSKRTMTFGL